jgi:ribonuclease P protein component
MLAKPNRLRTSTEFDRVFDRGRAAHGTLLSVRVLDADGFRAGFTVGKTVSLQAVVRNRVRRRLREIVRSLEPGPVDLVVSAKRPAAKADTAELRSELETLLKKTGALT